MNGLISVTQAAQILQTTPLQVIHLCRMGELPSGEISGAMVIPESAVRRFAKGRLTKDRHAPVA